MPLYAHYGMGYVWLIDPEARTLEAYALQDGMWVAIGRFTANEQVAIEPFEAVTIDLAGLWAWKSEPGENESCQ